jgi:hypothetical protein
MEKFKYTEPIRPKGIHKIIFGKIQEKVIDILRSFIDKIDIYEPFTRVETALKALCQKKS